MFRFRLRCPIAIHYLVQSYIHILNKIFPNNLLPWLFNRTIPSVSLCLVPPSLSACLPGLCISEEMSCQRLDWSVECGHHQPPAEVGVEKLQSDKHTYCQTVRLSLHSALTITLTRGTREPVLLCDSVGGEERRGDNCYQSSRHITALTEWVIMRMRTAARDQISGGQGSGKYLLDLQARIYISVSYSNYLFCLLRLSPCRLPAWSRRFPRGSLRIHKKKISSIQRGDLVDRKCCERKICIFILLMVALSNFKTHKNK